MTSLRGDGDGLSTLLYAQRTPVTRPHQRSLSAERACAAGYARPSLLPGDRKQGCPLVMQSVTTGG
jgi:hypothetical protein